MQSLCSTLSFKKFTLLYVLASLFQAAYAQHWILVDDRDPALSYEGSWSLGPCGESCLYPNLTNVYNETWHATQPGRSSGRTRVSLQFQGYAVVIGALLDNIHSDMVTSVTITLDQEPLTYYHASTNDGSVQTGAVIYYRDGLQYTTHTIQVDVSPQSIFLLDYIAIQDQPMDTGEPAGPNPPPTDGSSSSRPSVPSSTPSGSSSRSSSSSTTSSASGSITSTPTLTLSTLDPSGHATTSFNPSTFMVNNLQSMSGSVFISTSVDDSGRTIYFPATVFADGSDPTGHVGSSSHGNSHSSTAFSPALAGAIGAAGAAVAAVAVVIVMFCLRKKRRIQLRPQSAEPYILANETPTTQNSSLSAPTSPIPYTPVSALGLFYAHQPPTAPRPQMHLQTDLLSSPPPNTLLTPMTPTYGPMSYQLHPGFPPSQQPSPATPHPNSHMYLPYISPAEKLSRHQSLAPPRRASNMADMRSPVTALYPRPADWDIESELGRGQEPPLPIPLHLPPEEPQSASTPLASVPPSPAVPLPSPHSSSRRRSARRKEFLELPPPPPMPPQAQTPAMSMLDPNVPVIRHPSVPRRTRRGTTGSVPMLQDANGTYFVAVPMLAGGRSPTSDEESLPPVVRRQSLTHPAPPAYSPPRLVRNADLHDGMYR